MVLVDFMNSAHMSYSMAVRNIEKEQGRPFGEEDIPYFLHMFFMKIRKICATYDEVVLCYEGMNSLEFRRSIFPDYKRNRDAHKASESYALLKTALKKVDEFIKFLPVKEMRVEGAEADDLMFVLAEKYHSKGPITIITTDGDLSQLKLFFPTVQIYNPIKKTYVEPKPYLVESKAIIGDVSDNIPGIPKIGPKTFEKMMADKAFFYEKIKGDNKKIYEAFLNIVDLRKIPVEIKQRVLDKDLEVSYNEFKPQDLEVYFFENKMKETLMKWSGSL